MKKEKTIRITYQQARNLKRLSERVDDLKSKTFDILTKLEITESELLDVIREIYEPVSSSRGY